MELELKRLNEIVNKLIPVVNRQVNCSGQYSQIWSGMNSIIGEIKQNTQHGTVMLTETQLDDLKMKGASLARTLPLEATKSEDIQAIFKFFGSLEGLEGQKPAMGNGCR